MKTAKSTLTKKVRNANPIIDAKVKKEPVAEVKTKDCLIIVVPFGFHLINFVGEAMNRDFGFSEGGLTDLERKLFFVGDWTFIDKPFSVKLRVNEKSELPNYVFIPLASKEKDGNALVQCWMNIKAEFKLKTFFVDTESLKMLTQSIYLILQQELSRYGISLKDIQGLRVR